MQNITTVAQRGQNIGVLNQTSDMLHVYSNCRYFITLYDKLHRETVFLRIVFTQVRFCVWRAATLLSDPSVSVSFIEKSD